MAEKALQTQTRLSYPRRQELLAAYAAGKPVRQIAREFGIHRNTVTTIVNSEGAPVRRPRISSEAKAQALPLYESGMSLAAVAKELGISSAGARAIILDAGGTMRPAGMVRHPQH
jgi:transposase-like protein